MMKAKNTDIYRQFSEAEAEIEESIRKTPVEKQGLLMVASAAIHSDIFLLNLSMILQYQQYTIALETKLAQDKIAGLDTMALENEIQRAKDLIDALANKALDKVDTHLAKRIRQLYDFKGHEGMYDTGTKPSRTD